MKQGIENSKSRFAIAFLFLCILYFVSCTEKNKNKTSPPGLPRKDTVPVYKKPPSSFQDTVYIETSSAVFFNPDTLQLARIKESLSSMVFESNQHDCFFQMRNARMVIKQHWPAIRIVETSKARYLLFIKKDKTRTCIDLDSKGDMCGVFLFDPRKDPELVDMMNIDTALGFYFEK